MPGDENTPTGGNVGATSGDVVSTSSATIPDIRYNPISLPRFSGSSPTPKSEASYRVWKHQLEAIQIEESLNENRTRQLIRRSLVGEAAEVLVNLPISASSVEVISALDDNYGIDTEKVDGWTRFHSASQRNDESVTAWQMRLTGLMREADPANTFKDHRDKLLITAFWSNLHNKDLKIATAHIRKSATTFSEFFRSVKTEEPLYKSAQMSKPHKATTSTEEGLLREIHMLKLQNEEMQRQLKSRKQDKKYVCFYCDQEGHHIKDCPEKKKKYECTNRPSNFSRQGREGPALSRKQ